MCCKASRQTRKVWGKCSPFTIQHPFFGPWSKHPLTVGETVFMFTRFTRFRVLQLIICLFCIEEITEPDTRYNNFMAGSTAACNNSVQLPKLWFSDIMPVQRTTAKPVLTNHFCQFAQSPKCNTDVVSAWMNWWTFRLYAWLGLSQLQLN